LMRCARAVTPRARSSARAACSLPRPPRRRRSARGAPSHEHAMSDFTFCTAQYDSGDWDSAPLVPANLIDSVARYTSISVAPVGVNVPLGSTELFKYPLAYLTGHLPVRFSDLERRTLREYCSRGGMLFVDDHNHDIDGVFHKSAVEEIARAVGPLKELPNTHPLYSSFFKYDDGPPTTSHELNGWGDNLVHKHLLAVLHGDRIA